MHPIYRLADRLMNSANKEAIELAKLSKKPVVTILTAGRPR
jgi:hypothetical protein